MSDAPIIASVCKGALPTEVDVLFIHGLTGDPLTTWLSDETGEYWPKWLCDAFPGLAVYTIGYPSSLFEKFSAKEMGIHERANNLLEHLASYGFGERPIVFICHSLGGLLAKEILRTSNECIDDGWKLIASNTRLVCFLGTPHTGASMAVAIKLFMPRLASNSVTLLTNESGYLSSLNHAFRDLANMAGTLAVVSYFEKWKTKGTAVVVSRESADPGVGRTRPVGMDADHISICKPKDKNALIFTSICRHIRKVVADTKTAKPVCTDELFNADDYSAASQADRRDLLQKLIAAGREYEYDTANDFQNKFAQKYYRLGLFSEAKQKSDALLSEVHQRFVTHVFHAKICRQATDDEIAQALQDEVIDPLCIANVSGKPLSATAVLQALYYLTEQCYIRWDVP